MGRDSGTRDTDGRCLDLLYAGGRGPGRREWVTGEKEGIGTPTLCERGTRGSDKMEAYRIRGIAMNDDRPEDLAARLAKVESELARVKFERDMYKKSIYDSLRGSEFDVPMTEAEMEELMNAPQGESISSIIEEFEKRALATHEHRSLPHLKFAERR